MPQTIQWTGFSGVAQTAKLMALGSDTVIESQAGVESTNDKGEFSAVFAATNTGEHKLCIVATDGGAGFSRLRVNLTGSGTAIAFDAPFKIDSALERDGPMYRLTENALEMAPAGEGGDGGNVIVQPYSAHAPQRVKGTTLTAFLGEGNDVSITITCYDAEKTPLDLTGKTLRYCVAPYDDPLNPIFTSEPFTGSGSSFDLTLDLSFTGAEAIDGKAHTWSLREVTEVWQFGRLNVKATSVPPAIP